MTAALLEARDVCPQCRTKPAGWRERPAYGSRELYWIGCKTDGHLQGGITSLVALQNWSRFVARYKFDHAPKRAPAKV